MSDLSVRHTHRVAPLSSHWTPCFTGLMSSSLITNSRAASEAGPPLMENQVPGFQALGCLFTSSGSRTCSR